MANVTKKEVLKQSEAIVKTAVNKAIKENKQKEENRKRNNSRGASEHHGYPLTNTEKGIVKEEVEEDIEEEKKEKTIEAEEKTE